MEINETEDKNTVEKINEMATWLFEKINKIDKSLARLKEKEDTITSIRSEIGNTTIDSSDSER